MPEVESWDTRHASPGRLVSREDRPGVRTGVMPRLSIPDWVQGAPQKILFVIDSAPSSLTKWTEVAEAAGIAHKTARTHGAIFLGEGSFLRRNSDRTLVLTDAGRALLSEIQPAEGAGEHCILRFGSVAHMGVDSADGHSRIPVESNLPSHLQWEYRVLVALNFLAAAKPAAVARALFPETQTLASDSNHDQARRQLRALVGQGLASGTASVYSLTEAGFERLQERFRQRLEEDD